MNIVYIIHQFYPECWTGTEKFVLKISSMMQKAGHRVSVITYSVRRGARFNKRIGNILYKEFTYEGIRVIGLRHKHPTKYLNIGLGDNSMTDIAKYLLSTEKPDIIHIGHPMRVNELAIVAKSLNIPYIITLTDFWILCPKVILIDSEGDLCLGPLGGKTCAQYCPEFSSGFITQRLIKARDILNTAKGVISPSEFLRNIFQEEFKELNIEVLNHGISYNAIKNNKKIYKKGDALVFCYAGSLNHHKGIHVLIEAFKEIKSRNVILKIFGNGPNPSYVNQLFSMAKSDPRIEFCGLFPENKVGSILNNVDIVVVPALWYENHPLILHEALTCRKPVVASNIGGMAEKIQNGINGFTFPRGDKNRLRDVLEKITNNPTVLNNVKENIKHIFIPPIEQEAYAYYELYTKILKRNK